jgi:hypothetical protein
MTIVERSGMSRPRNPCAFTCQVVGVEGFIMALVSMHVQRTSLKINNNIFYFYLSLILVIIIVLIK